MARKDSNEALDTTITTALRELFADKKLEADQRIKALAVAVRWLAVKNKIVTGEHGSGLEDDF